MYLGSGPIIDQRSFDHYVRAWWPVDLALRPAALVLESRAGHCGIARRVLMLLFQSCGISPALMARIGVSDCPMRAMGSGNSIRAAQLNSDGDQFRLQGPQSSLTNHFAPRARIRKPRFFSTERLVRGHFSGYILAGVSFD